MGIAMGGQAFAVDNQLRFSRAAEHEADRVGFQMLSAAGYDPYAMTAFFDRLDRSTMADNGVPPYARTHPLTGERIADMEDRARRVPYRQPRQSPEYGFVRARSRVLQVSSPSDYRDIASRLQVGDRRPDGAERSGELVRHRARANADGRLRRGERCAGEGASAVRRGAGEHSGCGGAGRTVGGFVADGEADAGDIACARDRQGAHAAPIRQYGDGACRVTRAICNDATRRNRPHDANARADRSGPDPAHIAAAAQPAKPAAAARSSPSLDVLAADIARRAGHNDEAVRLAELAQKRWPESHAAIDMHLQALLTARRFAEAQTLAKQETRAEPKRPDWWFYLAQASVGLNDPLQQHQAMAEKFALDGAWPSAIRQLKEARDVKTASFYDLSTISARLRDFEVRYKEERELEKDERNG